ncbi:YfhO family protein [Anditalea andensis]|uniref:Membrane protein n=1 Tax=Anditalea andensis TaxID=1048983 RepID=A0A074KQZ1_9BACT|nr:YfhO family protein [Anditalea andensis]KEO72376.1 membrane protein [Anditalea andensis]
MHIDFRREILPHLLGIISFYLIVTVYFSPIVFDGKMMFQNDILQWEGSAREILDHRSTTGEEPLWTNRMFGGMPAYLISTEFPGDISNILIKVLTLGLPHPINSLFLGMVGMYILLLSFRIRSAIAVAGAWAFAFNTFHIISLEAGHNAKIWSICLIPLILAGIHLVFTRRVLLGAAIFALALMLQLKFNHLQITYYTLLIVFIYGIGQLIGFAKSRQMPDFGKAVGILTLSALLAIGANAGRLYTIYEYGNYSIRGAATLSGDDRAGDGLGRDYAFHWSQGKLETLTFLIPNFYGGGSREDLGQNSQSETVLHQNGVPASQIREFTRNAPTYWGDQPGTGGPIYGGAIMVFLFVLGLLFAPVKYRVIFLAITFLSFMLAWGSNLAWFNYTLFDYLPGYNKFRAVSMALCMALFSIPVLGAIGLERILKSTRNPKVVKSLGIAFGIAGGLALIFALFPGLFGYRAPVDEQLPDFLRDALRTDRKNMLRSDAWRTFILIALTAGLIFSYLKNKIMANYAAIGIAVLVLLDVWLVNRRYLDNDSFVLNPRAQFFAPTPADERIMADDSYFRVLNLDNPFNEARTSYRFNSIGGYHGAKMRRYQDLIERVLSGEMSRFISRAQEGNFDFTDLNGLNMLNTKYFYIGTSENQVFRNDYAMGEGWFPENIITVNNNDEEITLLNEANIRNSATLNTQEFGQAHSGIGEVRLKHYQPNQISYIIEASQGGLVVFSEIYYPKGWKASINGNDVEILRVNYLLRGLSVPDGSSEVIFRFEPDGYYTTTSLMVILQYIILLLLIGSIIVNVKQIKNGREG